MIKPSLQIVQRWLLLFPLSPRWGDDQFLGGLYFLPFLAPYLDAGCPRAPCSLWGAFFIWSDSHEKWSMVIENDCARPFLSFHRARGRARTPRPKGAVRPAVFACQAKSSKGGVRPQHFSVREGYKERFDNKRSLLEAQPLTRSWTYRQARAASPEPASLSWAGNPNAECGRQSTAENLLGGKYIE